MRLHHWRYRLHFLWLIQLMTVSTMEMSGPFWPIYFKQLLTQTPFSFIDISNSHWINIFAALAYILPLLAAMLSAPFWGRVGDKYGHKLMILRALFALGLCQFLLVYVQQPWLILLLRTMQGFTAGTIAATQSYAAKMSPTNKRGQVFSRIQSATAAGSLLGPLVGGYWLAEQTMPQLFAQSSVIFIVLLLVIYGLLPHDNVKKNLLKTSSASTKTVAADILWQPAILLTAICLAQIAKRLPQSFYALYAETIIGQGSFMIGVLYSATGLGILLTAPISGYYFDRLKQGKHQQYFLQTICVVALLLMLWQSQITQFYPALMVRFLWGGCLAAILPLLSAQLSAFGGLKNIGKQVGISHSAIKLGGILGIGLGSAIFSLLNWQWAFASIALVYGALIALLNKRNVVAKPKAIILKKSTTKTTTTKTIKSAVT